MEKYLICGIVVVIAIAVVLLLKNKSCKCQSKSFVLPDGFTYTGHTGCVGTKDNSLEAIDKAVEFGVDIVEFDIRFDGKQHILSHDDPVGGEATLRDALLTVKKYDGLKANIDVKEVKGIEHVQPLAEELGMLDRVFFTGIFEDDAPVVAEKCPKIHYYLNMSVASSSKQTKEYLAKIIGIVKKCGAVGINFNHKHLTPKLVEAFRKEGLFVSVWTVNKEDKMYKALGCAVDNITTRRPDMLSKIIKGE
jgi:glycerophosphoryl diester phosphodiesterase